MLKICFATGELHPFSKVGGLADVSSGLARHLALHGHEVRIFSPLHATVDTRKHALKAMARLRDVPVRIGSTEFRFSIHSAKLRDCAAKVYLVHCPELYDRRSIYTSSPDEARRFILLTRAVFECCRRLEWAPDILHCHDWPTALAPFFRRSIYAGDPIFEATRTVLTVHNFAYQGVFPADTRDDVAPPEHAHLLHQDDLRAGVLNFLKTGLLYADAVTTVSPAYAAELSGPGGDFGLRATLDGRGDAVRGILNGIDDEEWSPRSDPAIAKHYNARGPVTGKRENKKALLGRLGLSSRDGGPLVAMITRLTADKGVDLLVEALPPLLEARDFQFVVIGEGEPRYHAILREVQSMHPARVVFYDGHSEELAHLLLAAADLLLAPSRMEPCGLQPMYALQYGTVPVVRKTGGLSDTVEPWNPKTKTGSGFVFEDFSPHGMRAALELALDTCQDRKAWLRLMRNGMSTDFSWRRRIPEYLDVYGSLQARPQGPSVPGRKAPIRRS